jgi:hypothetical protein
VRFPRGGYDEALGFTVYDTLRYREALQPLVRARGRGAARAARGIEPGRAAAIVARGASRCAS